MKIKDHGWAERWPVPRRVALKLPCPEHGTILAYPFTGEGGNGDSEIQNVG